MKVQIARVLILATVASMAANLGIAAVQIGSWQKRCQVDRLTDNQICTVYFLHRAHYRGRLVYLMFQVQQEAGRPKAVGTTGVGVVLSTAALRIDRNPPHQTRQCIKAGCSFSSGEQGAILRELKAGKSMFVRVHTTLGDIIEADIPLGAFLDVYKEPAKRQ